MSTQQTLEYVRIHVYLLHIHQTIHLLPKEREEMDAILCNFPPAKEEADRYQSYLLIMITIITLLTGQAFHLLIKMIKRVAPSEAPDAPNVHNYR